MGPHPLAGGFSVDASARRIRHYRYAEERMMRALGGWIALTPELPAKLLFGRHVWDCAQHADLWGRRLPELRARAQVSEPANDLVVRFMDLVEDAEGPEQTVERVVGVYRVLKPHLLALYEEHLAAANPVYEPPTRRILERCIAEERRHVAAAATLAAGLFSGEADRARAEARERRLLEALGEARGVTGDRERPPVAVIVPGPGGDQDLVAVGGAFDPRVLDSDLAAAVDRLARALVAGDRVRAGEPVAESVRALLLAAWEPLGRIDRCEVVAQARIGAHRVVKVRIAGARGATVVQLLWQRGREGWRVAGAEVLPPPMPAS